MDWLDGGVEPSDFDIVEEEMDRTPKVYQMNDCDWWMARSASEAVRSYCSTVGLPVREACDKASFHMLTETELDTLKHIGDPYIPVEENKPYPMTFREALKRLVEQGIEIPGFFATTEY